MGILDIFKKKEDAKLTEAEKKYNSKEYKQSIERAKKQTIEASQISGLREDTLDSYKAEAEHWDESTRHYELIHIIDEEYKRLNENNLLQDSKACKKIIELCNEDISLAVAMKDYFYRTMPHCGLPRYPSFKRLSIVYENLGDIQNAIAVLEKAIELGYTSDNTKNGLPGRIDKLKKKTFK